MRGGVGPDERGASFTVSYALSIAIATVLVGGIVLTAGGTVTDAREDAVRDGLRVVGDDVATTLMAVDRAARAGTRANVTVRRSLPATVADEPYTMALRDDPGDNATLVLSTQVPPVTVRVPLVVGSGVGTTERAGGDLVVTYRTDTGVVTLADA